MTKTFKTIGFVAVVAVLIWLGTRYNANLDKQSVSESRQKQGAAAIAEQKIMDNLKIEDVVVGTGAEAKSGNVVSVNYLGTLLDGTKFDSSYDRGTSFEFTLGTGQVIKGWDLGVAGMKVGGKRNLTIPPELAYGANQVGPIPANSTLKFTVELLGIK